MQAVITAVFAFLNTALLSGFFFNRFDMDIGLAFLFDERRVAPMIMLAYGLPVAAFGYGLVLRYLQHTPAGQTRFPRFAFTEFENAEMDQLWQNLSVLIVCLLPLAAFGWAWFEFATHGEVWRNDGTYTEVSRWAPVPFELVYTDRWHDYRYGELNAARTGRKTDNGASFLPFWHSVIWMGGMSLCVAIQVLRITGQYLRRKTLPD